MLSCSVCKKSKEPEAFNRDSTSKTGRDRRCRACVAVYKSEYRKRPISKLRQTFYNKDHHKRLLGEDVNGLIVDRKAEIARAQGRILVGDLISCIKCHELRDRLSYPVNKYGESSICKICFTDERYVEQLNAILKKRGGLKRVTRAFVRFVWDQFESRCFICQSNSNLSLDHHIHCKVNPELIGNAVLLCLKCNGIKRDLPPRIIYNKSQLTRIAWRLKAQRVKYDAPPSR